MNTDGNPHISVIIPTLNDTLIAQVVDRVCAEVDKSSEVIVVGRDDNRRIPRNSLVHFIETDHPVGASEARNIGIGAAKGEWLLFVDSDCFVLPGWFERLTARLSSGEMVVGGGVLSPTDDYWMLVYNISMFHEFLVGASAGHKAYLPTLNLGVRREVVDQVGLMDARLPRGQDMDWTIRMALSGYRLCFEPRAVVEHRPQKSGLAAIWATWLRGGFYNIENRLKYADYYRTPRLMRSAFLMAALSPLIGVYTTVRMYMRRPDLLVHLSAIPLVYLTKIAWCIGAAQALRRKSKLLLVS